MSVPMYARPKLIVQAIARTKQEAKEPRSIYGPAIERQTRGGLDYLAADARLRLVVLHEVLRRAEGRA